MTLKTLKNKTIREVNFLKSQKHSIKEVNNKVQIQNTKFDTLHGQ